MKISKIIFLIFIILFAIPANNIHAKRLPPPPIDIIWFGTRYTANLENQKMGYLYAYGPKTEFLLWEKKIYDVKYNPLLESDVQDVFISKIFPKGDILVVVNEKGDQYEVNPKTGDVLNQQKIPAWIIWTGFSLAGIAILFIIYKFLLKKIKL